MWTDCGGILNKHCSGSGGVGQRPCLVGLLFSGRLAGQVRLGLVLGQVWVRFGLGLGKVRVRLGFDQAWVSLGQVWVRLGMGQVRLGLGKVKLFLDNSATHLITVKKMATKIHQKMSMKIHPKRGILVDKMSPKVSMGIHLHCCVNCFKFYRQKLCFFLYPHLGIKSKTNAYRRHLLQNVE